MSSISKANPILLEPIMKVEVSTPDEYQGELMGDLNRRRGQIQGMETRGTVCVINSFVLKCLILFFISTFLAI